MCRVNSRAIRAYLDERVRLQYLDILPSRWRALLFRLAKRTQALQRDDGITTNNSREMAGVRDDFDLANALLLEEHEVYRDGAAFLSGQSDGEEDAPAASLRLFLQGMLTCIATKEAVIAHWKSCVTSIPPDTLRVYCHVCVAHPHVQKDDLERISLLFAAKTRHPLMDELRQLASKYKTKLVKWGQPWVTKWDGALHTGFGISLHILKRLLFTLTVVGTVLFIISLVLFLCLVASVVGSILIRWYVLLLVPGNELFTLNFNNMPLETEHWRHVDLTNTIAQLESRAEQPPLGYGSSGNRDNATVLLNVNGMGEARVPYSLRSDANALKMALITRLVHSTVATSTFIIPSSARRDVFLPDGGVSIEGLFRQRNPMFNARGVYSAKMQLVFLKEDVGRDVALLLESSVLMSKDPYMPQSLSSLDVLFKTSSSFTVRTGERFSSWLTQFFMWLVHCGTYVPSWIWQKLSPVLDPDAFPTLDTATEVAVVVPVYSDFEPPLYLQPHLRAINFTIYQSQKSHDQNVRLVRLHLYSSVELSGLAYYFLNYTFSSLVSATVLLEVVLGGATLIVLTLLCIYYREALGNMIPSVSPR